MAELTPQFNLRAPKLLFFLGAPPPAPGRSNTGSLPWKHHREAGSSAPHRPSDDTLPEEPWAAICNSTGLTSNGHGGLFPAGILKAASPLCTSGIWTMALPE